MSRKALLAGMLASALALPATAATLTLGGVEIPGQGLFSLEPVDFTETFDHGGACGLSASSPLWFDGASADPGDIEAWVNSPTPPVGGPSPPTAPSGVILTGSTEARHKTPVGNSSCYLASTDTTMWLGPNIEYVGFHWSSIDEYNRLGEIEVFFGGYITGAQIWTDFAITPYSDQYVNIRFPTCNYSGLVFNSQGNWSFEIDNVSIRHFSSCPTSVAPASARSAFAVAAVPAPAGCALFLFVVAALTAGRRHTHLQENRS